MSGRHSNFLSNSIKSSTLIFLLYKSFLAGKVM